MNRHYEDLLALTTQKPSFFQEGGVPRWTDFTPGDSTGKYTVDCAIAEISCQLCDMRFHVLMESCSTDRQSIAERIQDKSLAYRDPPNVDCCAGGASTTSEMVRVIEYWRRMEVFHWKRDTALETTFRRSSDPWTDSMRTRAQAIIDDPKTRPDLRDSMAYSLACDDEQRATVAEEPAPTYASDFRTTA